jgi:predicted secreted protein
MVANVGRELLVKKNSTVIAGIRTATLDWSGESIDVTTGEDAGVRLLLEASAQEQIDMPIEGIMKEEELRDLTIGASADRILTDIEIEWPITDPANSTPATLTGNFRLSSYSEGAPYNEAITFSGTLESSGPFVYTAES